MDPNQQKKLNREQKDQLRFVKRAEKVNVMGVYFDQSDQIISYIKNLTDDIWADRDALMRELGRLDIAFDKYNLDIYPSLLEANLATANLGADHIQEFSGYRVPQELVTHTVLDNIYNPETGFFLPESVWDEKKKTKLYQNVLKSQASGLSQGEASEITDDYLKNSVTHGQYYNVERIVDNETQSNYSDSYLSSMFANNRALIGLELYYERKLSAFHRVYDICDELAGVWAINKLVPGVPSHSNCACEANVILRGPAKGPLKEFRSPRVKYKDQEVDLYKPKPRKARSIMPKSGNQWNARWERLTKMFTGNDLLKEMQKLVNDIISSGTKDPVALQMLITIKTIYGIS